MEHERTRREEFLDLLDRLIAELPIRRVICGNKQPNPPENECVEIYSRIVLDIPFEGEKHLWCGDGHQLREYRLFPGDILLSPRAVWKLPVWDTPHKLFCLVFTEEYLRCTYVDYTGENVQGTRPICNCFFHTKEPPPSLVLSVLRTMIQLGLSGDPADASPKLAEALLRLCRESLVGDRPCVETGKAQRTYRLLRQYLVENFSLPLTREDTAHRFGLNPSYLSRLFQQQTGKSFSCVLREIRMEHAAFLLRNTELLVDEITLQCGYASTPFFTTIFKAYHGVPPGEFRRSIPVS